MLAQYPAMLTGRAARVMKSQLPRAEKSMAKDQTYHPKHIRPFAAYIDPASNLRQAFSYLREVRKSLLALGRQSQVHHADVREECVASEWLIGIL